MNWGRTLLWTGRGSQNPSYLRAAEFDVGCCKLFTSVHASKILAGMRETDCYGSWRERVVV